MSDKVEIRTLNGHALADTKAREALENKQPKGDYATRDEIPSVPVQSVNNKTGAVQLTAADVGAADAKETAQALDVLSGEIEEINAASLSSITRESSNIVNLDGITAGHSIAADGTISENSTYNISDYIPITSGGKYVAASTYAIAWYDAEKVFINRAWTNKGVVFTAPSTAHYLRISSDVQPRAWQINAGETLLNYDEHYKIIDKVRLPKELASSSDAVIFSGNIEQMFDLTDSPDVAFDIYNTTAAQVYAMYDSLVTQYPQYITKEVLGNDDDGNEIALYRMTPVRGTVEHATNVPTALYRTPKIPTVFINCGLHGNEHSSAFVTYLFFREMCAEWANNEIYEVLRHDVNYLVIPVANPSGWNAYTRKNGNGVDINRNFPTGFYPMSDSSNAQYGGSEPLTEKETQYIKSVLDNNVIDVLIDFHETARSSVSDENLIMWVSTNSTYNLHIAQSCIEKMSRKFKKDYEWAMGAEGSHGYTRLTLFEGMLKDEAVASGIKFASSFEVVSAWGLYDGAAAFDSIHAKTTVECFVNFLLYNLRQVRREYHQMSDYLGS